MIRPSIYAREFREIRPSLINRRREKIRKNVRRFSRGRFPVL